MNTEQIAQIASHLNVSPNQVTRVEEWDKVFFAVVKGLGARFVSKKVVAAQVTTLQAANLIQARVGGKVWDKKAGETRLYIGQGYLRFVADEVKVYWNLKSYDVTAEINAAVEAFKAQYQITPGSVEAPVLMQEDEDGIIAPVGQHEPGVYIVREWMEVR